MKRLIITITPFPSIEYIYSVETFISKEILPSKNVSLNVLSKGVYSAQMMKVLQEEPILISNFGGFAGKSIKHYLDKAKVKSDIVWTNYETPHQVKILLDKSTDYYRLRSQEAFTMDKELDKLSYKLKSHIKKVSTLVISGKLPLGQNEGIYREWIREAKLHNIKAIISIGQKDVWNQMIQEKPYAILLTEDQLRTLAFPTDTYEAITESLIPFLGEGLHFICVYLKNRGALVLSRHKYCLIESPFQLINKNNTATSGAFLGALAISINRKYEQEKLGKLCLAASLSANDNVMHKICTRKDVDTRYKKTKVKQILL